MDGEKKEEIEKIFKEFLRRNGYRIPEDEEEARQLRRAIDAIVDIVGAKRTMGAKARAAIAWTLAATLTLGVARALWKEVGKAVSLATGGGPG